MTSSVPSTSNGGVYHSVKPNLHDSIHQSPRTLYSIAQAIATWVYENLRALWNQMVLWIGGCFSNTNPQRIDSRIEIEWINTTLDAYKDAISNETNYPYTIFIAIHIEGKNISDFFRMNMRQIRGPLKDWIWHEELRQGMSEYLTKNKATKTEVGFCIATHAENRCYNLDIGHTLLVPESSISIHDRRPYPNMSLDYFNNTFKNDFPIFRLLLDMDMDNVSHYNLDDW